MHAYVTSRPLDLWPTTELNKKNEILSSENAQLLDEHADVSARTRDQLRDAAVAKEEATAQVHTLQAHVARLEEKTEAMRQRAQELDVELVGTKAATQDAAALRAQCESLQESLASVTEELVASKADVTQSKDSLHRKVTCVFFLLRMTLFNMRIIRPQSQRCEM